MGIPHRAFADFSILDVVHGCRELLPISVRYADLWSVLLVQSVYVDFVQYP